MCLNIGTTKTINFPFGTNGKLMVLVVPISKHFMVKMDLVETFGKFYQKGLYMTI